MRENNASGLKTEKVEEEKTRSVRLKPINRQQMVLRPMDVERLVPEDNGVRAVWEFVGRLDLRQYYEEVDAVEGEAGRSAFDPRLMISLWIYAYSKGIGSGREISRLCEYDPAYQWLTGLEPVNYHTLSDFRVTHKEALDELFAEVLGLLSAEGLISLERVMHDGSKVKACASGDTFRREERIRVHLELAREQVEAMGDPRAAEEVGPRVVKARQRAAREKQERLELALREMEKIRATKPSKAAKQEVRVSITDPEARVMKQSDGGYGPSYNVQISTDAKEKVIVGVGVSQCGSDYEELVSAEERVEEVMGSAPEQMVTDGADPTFYPEAFHYDAVCDAYRCPAGKSLRSDGEEKRPGRTNYKYRASAADCLKCPFKEKCCPQNEAMGRTIVRGVDDPVVVAHKEKMETEEAKQIYRQRGAVAEFPNAWLKEKIGLRRFRLRGLIKVGMEVLWACLAYNIQQWIRLCWRPQWAQV
jgi:transposase